jgi:hypothetical protein
MKGAVSMATASKGASQLDQRAKIKLIAASAVLVLALVWIVAWLGVFDRKAAAPTLSPEQAAQQEQDHAQELEKVKEETNKSYRGGHPPLPPGSS